MKKRKVFEISKLPIYVLFIVLFFVKIFYFQSIVPANDYETTGNIYRYDKFFSIYDNLKDEGLQFLSIIFVCFLALAVVFAVFNISVESKKVLRVVSDIFYAGSIILFFVLFFISAGVGRGV